MKAVLVTGIGAISPVGVGRAAFWQALLEGVRGLRPLTRFNSDALPCRVAGEVDVQFLNELVDEKIRRTAPLFTQLAVLASGLALDDARLRESRYSPERIGVVVGTALGGWSDAEPQIALMLERGVRRINPFIVSGAGAHGAGAAVSKLLGATGPQFVFSAGCPSGLQALAHGAELVRSGFVDLCLVVGTEAPLSASIFSSLCRTHELGTLNETPGTASRPFDKSRTGMILSEGACALVLESAASFEPRKVAPYAEYIDAGFSCDAQGLYGVDAEGTVAYGAVQSMLSRSKRTPSDIDYVCSHANSSRTFDSKEARVLRRLFDPADHDVAVSSIKGSIGHPIGAAPVFQSAAACLALRQGILPPTTNLEEPDEECGPGYLTGKPIARAIRTALVTSYGYGGSNGCLLLRRV
jgi:3-oxoacyl-[acyl-carrier-protein] synthase II